MTPKSVTCWQYLHQKFSYQFEQCSGKRRGTGLGIEWGRRQGTGWGISKSSFLGTVSSVPKLVLGSLCRLWGQHLPREIVPERGFITVLWTYKPGRKCKIDWLGRGVFGVVQCESLVDQRIQSEVGSTVAIPAVLDFPDRVPSLSREAPSDLTHSNHYFVVALVSIANHFHS